MMHSRLGSILMGVTICLLAFIVATGSGWAKTRKAKCEKGQSLQKRIDKAKPGDTILITGTCLENVVIPADKSDLLIIGENGAGISGPDSDSNTVEVRGRDITIQNLTIQGGKDGISALFGAHVTILGCTIGSCNNGGNGIFVGNGSFADIGLSGPPNARQFSANNITGCRNGILVDRVSGAEISDNLITNNHVGIELISGAAAKIGVPFGASTGANSISNNTGDGVRVLLGSSTEIIGNLLNGNGGDGVRIEGNSTAKLDANVTEILNGGYGLFCEGNSFATGSLNTLNGLDGASMGAQGCILNF